MRTLAPLFSFVFAACLATYPPQPITSQGSYGMASSVDVMGRFPYDGAGLACLVDAAFAAFVDASRETAKLSEIHDRLARTAFLSADEETFHQYCRVPSTQATSCLSRVGKENTWRWLVVVRSSHFDAYTDVPGEPMIHELIHAIAKHVSNDYDYRHANPVLWAAAGPDSAQGLAQARFRGQCGAHVR